MINSSVKDFYEKLEEERAEKLLNLSTDYLFLIGATKVYINSEMLRETIYLDEELEFIKDTQAKYQIFFTRDKTQFGFNTIVQGNAEDNRYTLGFRMLKGYKLEKILRELWKRENCIESME